MDCEFYVQDPGSPETVYLLEAILEALQGASSCTGMFAFASRDGVDCLINDDITREFLRVSPMTLLVGIDAVTDDIALQLLQELEERHDQLTIQVFWNPTGALFHPKVLRLQYPNGDQRMIVGSGNLTPGGLRGNFEAFAVLRAGPEERFTVDAWDRFLVDHAENIRPIDEQALLRAAKNVTLRRSGQVGQVSGRVSPTLAQTGGHPSVRETGLSRRILVAQVPKAGGRWHQVHLNAAVIERFFRNPAGHDSARFSQRMWTGRDDRGRGSAPMRVQRPK